MIKQSIKTDEAPSPIGTYSQAICTDGLVFVSGQIGLDPHSMELRQSFSEQAKQVFNNLDAIAREVNVSLNNIVKLTVFLKNLDDFSEFNQIMARYFVQPYPARSAVGISQLPKNALVEVEAIIKL